MAQRSHFEVEGGEILFPEPVQCKHLERLTCVGMCLDHDFLVHGIFELRGSQETRRIYLGPDLATVRQRAAHLADTMQAAGVQQLLTLIVRAWLEATWSMLVDTAAEAGAEVLVDELGL